MNSASLFPFLSNLSPRAIRLSLWLCAIVPWLFSSFTYAADEVIADFEGADFGGGELEEAAQFGGERGWGEGVLEIDHVGTILACGGVGRRVS